MDVVVECEAGLTVIDRVDEPAASLPLATTLAVTTQGPVPTPVKLTVDPASEQPVPFWFVTR